MTPALKVQAGLRQGQYVCKPCQHGGRISWREVLPKLVRPMTLGTRAQLQWIKIAGQSHDNSDPQQAAGL